MMEVSDVRKRVNEAVDRAKRAAAARRQRMDDGSRQYDRFLNNVAIPLFKQIASSLKPLAHSFTVFTPGGSVRLTSDRAPEDFIEISLDTGGDAPVVIGHVSRGRGRRVMESEQPIGTSIADITEEQLLAFVLKELEPFVEK